MRHPFCAGLSGSHISLFLSFYGNKGHFCPSRGIILGLTERQQGCRPRCPDVTSLSVHTLSSDDQLDLAFPRWEQLQAHIKRLVGRLDKTLLDAYFVAHRCKGIYLQLIIYLDSL